MSLESKSSSGRLVARRADLKISQMKLAQISGVSRFRIHLFENGYTLLNKLELNKIEIALRKLKTVRDAQ